LVDTDTLLKIYLQVTKKPLPVRLKYKYPPMRKAHNTHTYG